VVFYHRRPGVAGFHEQPSLGCQVISTLLQDRVDQIQSRSATGESHDRFLPILLWQAPHDPIQHIGRVGKNQIVSFPVQRREKI